MPETAVTVGGALIGNVKLANPPAPFMETSPAISGTTSYAGSLTIATPASFKGPWMVTGQVWQNNGEDTDQTGSSYVKSAADAGDQIRLKTFASGPGGSVVVYSPPITIVDLLSFNSGTLPQGQNGSAYSFTLTATGGTAPYTFAVSALPAGLSLNASTGVISGTPSAVGSTAYTATVTDANGLTATMSGTAEVATTPVGTINDLTYSIVTSNSVQLVFTAASNATSYQYRLNAGAWTALAADKIVTGLSPLTTYTIDVRGVNAFGNGADSNDVSVTTSASGAPTAGLAYTPSYVPAFTPRATRAALLSDLGLTTGDVITASDYANVEAALDAANAALKPLVIGTDNGAYMATTTRTRVYVDVPIYGYGSTMPRITGASRLTGWLCVRGNNVKIRNIEFKDFTQAIMYTPGTMPLARPNDSGYNAATSPAIRSPYHTSNDALVVACLAAVDAGFITQGCGHFNVSGSPTVTSIVPVRLQQDGGPGGTRIPYNYKPSGQTYSIYDDCNPAGDANWAAVLDGAAPNLLASPVTNATNASLVVAINANSGASGYSAQLDPATGMVVILSTSYLNRPFDWTVVSSGGSVTFDAVGPDLDTSYCKFSGCDRAIGGIGDTTAIGRIDFHKNIGRATWGAISFSVLQWTEFWGGNNDWGDCLLNGGAYGTVAGRTAGNAQNRATNQDGTFAWFGSNNIGHLRYIKARGGTKRHFDNNVVFDTEGNTNKDTVNSAVVLDTRLIWDTSANRRDNHTANYNIITNVRNVLGAIDCNWAYQKGSSGTYIGNIINGVGAKRRSGYRGVVSSGSEATVILLKNNDRDYDPLGVVRIAGNYITGIPNGIPPIKWDDFGGNVEIENNRISGWSAQMDDATLGDATGRALVLWEGTATAANLTWAGNATASGTSLVINSTTSGTLSEGMVIKIGSSSQTIFSGSGNNWTLAGTMNASGAATASGTILEVNSTTSGALAVGMRIVIGASEQTIKYASSTKWSLVGSMTASGVATADYINIIDGALVRGYATTANVKYVSNFEQNIDDQGRSTFLLHQITNLGGSFAGWEFSNNIAQNDGSAAYPALTGQEDRYHLNNTPSGMGAFANMILGRNKALSPAGAEVGNITFRFGNTFYSDNGNSTSKPYVPVP